MNEELKIPLDLEYTVASCLVRDDRNLPFAAITCALRKGHEGDFHIGKWGRAFFAWPINKQKKKNDLHKTTR